MPGHAPPVSQDAHGLKLSPPTEPAWPEFGFAHVELNNVGSGLQAAGWTPKLLRIDRDDDVAEINAKIRHTTLEDARVALVVSGDVARRMAFLAGCTPAMVALCAEPAVLRQQGVAVWDEDLPEQPHVLSSPAQELLDDLEHARQLTKVTLAVGDNPNNEAQQLLVLAATKPGLQGNGLLVLQGDEDHALAVASATRGWAVIAINPRDGT